MAAQQESSNVGIHDIEEHKGNIDSDPNFVSDIVESPIVTLNTPFPQPAIRTHAATLRKWQEAEKELKSQQRKIQELTFSLEIHDAHIENVRHASTIPHIPSIPPATSAISAIIETPDEARTSRGPCL
jgi:hypothetical protein